MRLRFSRLLTMLISGYLYCYVDVNQWMLKTLSNIPTFTGLNFVLSTMLGDMTPLDNVFIFISCLCVLVYLGLLLIGLVISYGELRWYRVLSFYLYVYRFAKKKLDEHVFLGNRLQVSYASHFESLSDTKDKLEGRRREVMARLNRKLHLDLIIWVNNTPQRIRRNLICFCNMRCLWFQLEDSEDHQHTTLGYRMSVYHLQLRHIQTTKLLLQSMIKGKQML